MVSNLLKVALVGAVTVPFAWLRSDDEKSSDDKKAEKRVEVKVLRLDGNDGGGSPTFKVLLNDGDGKPAGKQPYLGVAIDAVPPALVALPGLISKDQGLLVGEVAEDSPAAKAGLKEYDILLSYEDQKLYSGEQLTKLVRGDKPGHEVTLSVARAGKLEKVKVTIGEREMKAAMIELPGKGQHILLDPQGHRKESIRILKGLDEKDAGGAKKANVQTKSNSLSMRLETSDGDRFKAEIEFKNDKGETQKRTFEGTREEIHKQIEGDKEIPEAIRKQFGHGLDFGKGGKGAFQFQLPSGGFQFSLPFDHDDFPAFNWAGSKDFEQIVEQLSNQIDPALREKLKGALRSIDEPSHKKDVPVDRAL